MNSTYIRDHAHISLRVLYTGGQPPPSQSSRPVSGETIEEREDETLEATDSADSALADNSKAEEEVEDARELEEEKTDDDAKIDPEEAPPTP